MGPDEWRWSDEQGVQRLVRTDELRSALASKVLPASTPVWRQGMAEWLPADQVAELRAAVSGVAPEVKPQPRRTLAGVAAPKPAPRPGLPSPRNPFESPQRSVTLPSPHGPAGRPAPREKSAPAAARKEETSTLILEEAQGDLEEVSAVLDASDMRPVAPPQPRHHAHTIRAAPPPAGALPSFGLVEQGQTPEPTADLAPAFPRPAPLPQESTMVMALPSAAPPPPAEPAPQPAISYAPPPQAAAEPAPAPMDPGPPAAPASMPYGMTPQPPSYSMRPSMRPGQRVEDPLLIPLASLLGVGGFIVASVVVAFFFGRFSADASPVTLARPGIARAIDAASRAMPVAPKPCWVVKQPVRWAGEASKSIPFELLATPTNSVALGYARDSERAAGIEVSPTSGEVVERFSRAMKGATIDRVSPLASDPLDFFVSTVQGGDIARSYVAVPAKQGFLVSIDRTSVGVTDAVEVEPVSAWSLEGEGDPSAARVEIVGEKGFAVTLRRGGSVFGGWLGPDKKPVGNLVKIEGSGGAVGKPVPGSNGREVAVVFADRPEGEAWQIRLAHGPAGAIPTSTTVMALPSGGPGGDAFAPGIAGLPDGRWMLVWTEGRPGSRAVRAQTLAADFSAVGDPIALSPPAGSFGQGVLGVAMPYVAAVFLSKGEESFELWGSLLRCQ